MSAKWSRKSCPIILQIGVTPYVCVRALLSEFSSSGSGRILTTEGLSGVHVGLPHIRRERVIRYYDRFWLSSPLLTLLHPGPDNESGASLRFLPLGHIYAIYTRRLHSVPVRAGERVLSGVRITGFHRNTPSCSPMHARKHCGHIATKFAIIASTLNGLKRRRVERTVNKPPRENL